MSTRTHPSGAPEVPQGHSALEGRLVDVPQVLSLDDFIERTGGWGTLLALYMSLGGNISGLPRAAQSFLADQLEQAKSGQVNETQTTICRWADQTFGLATPEASLARMLKEITELRDYVESTPGDHLDWAKVLDECADIAICMARVAHTKNVVLQDYVNRKMAVNRKRRWRSHGDGTGQHMPEETALPEPQP